MNMKRLLALALALGLMLCLCACGGETPETTEPSTQPTTLSTEPLIKPTEPPVVAKPTYVVTVVDEENAPVAGAWVQLCLESCVPAMTDENGVANFFLEEADYKVGFTVMPAGYEYATDEQEWHFADGENTMTIILKKSA
jgi:hypothetical protein